MANLKETSTTSIVTVFSIEHMLILIVVVVRYFYAGPPKWVQIFHDRRHFKSFRKAEKIGGFKKKILK